MDRAPSPAPPCGRASGRRWDLLCHQRPTSAGRTARPALASCRTPVRMRAAWDGDRISNPWQRARLLLSSSPNLVPHQAASHDQRATAHARTPSSQAAHTQLTPPHPTSTTQVVLPRRPRLCRAPLRDGAIRALRQGVREAFARRSSRRTRQAPKPAATRATVAVPPHASSQEAPACSPYLPRTSSLASPPRPPHQRHGMTLAACEAQLMQRTDKRVASGLQAFVLLRSVSWSCACLSITCCCNNFPLLMLLSSSRAPKKLRSCTNSQYYKQATQASQLDKNTHHRGSVPTKRHRSSPPPPLRAAPTSVSK